MITSRTERAQNPFSVARRSQFSILAVVAAFVVVAAVICVFPKAVRHFLTPTVDPGPLVYQRSVIMLLDLTDSETPEVQQRVKDVVKTGIVDQLRPGDYAAAYALGTDRRGFDEVANRILGDMPQLVPMARARFSNPGNLGTVFKAELTTQWKDLTDLKGKWRQAIDATKPPKDSCCSAYLSAAAYIESRLTNGSLPGEVTVVIVGDLYPEPVPQPFVPPEPEEGQRNLYRGARVWLVRPFTLRGHHSRTEVDAYWNMYLSQRGGQVQFYDLSGFPGLEASSTPKLD